MSCSGLAIMMGAGGRDWGIEMNEQLATDLGHLVEELAKEARPTEPANLARLGEQVASLFKAKSDEVAVLALTGQDKFLKFIIPEKLQAIGTLPMTSTSALAVRTAREKRPELFNNFAGTRHATVFEGVPLGRRHDEPIQKLMSAPIFVEIEEHTSELQSRPHLVCRLLLEKKNENRTSVRTVDSIKKIAHELLSTRP